MQQQPLTGVTVLDFGQVYNGPYCGFLMAQAGARVIKVESPRGETLRPGRRANSGSYPFAVLNSNKESITLNLKSEPARQLLREMVKKVDVVFENFAPGTMDRHGVGADVLRRENPRLIYASSTGYGVSAGPYKDFLGMDITLQAMTGVMSITGEAGGPPLKSAAAFADFIAGTHLYGAIVSALFARTQTGEGATIDISMQDCVFPTLSSAIASYYLTGEEPARSGNRHSGRTLAPYNVFETRDGYVAIICIREGHWRKLCKGMGREAMAADPRFCDFPSRCENIDALEAEVTAWTAARTRAEVFTTLQEHDVICAPVNELQDVLADPHLAARGTLEPRPHDTLGEIAQPHTPLRFRDLDPPALTDAPDLGAHTADVLAELAGVDAERLAALRDAEAI